MRVLFSTGLGTLNQTSRKLLISSNMLKVFDAFILLVSSRFSELDLSAGLAYFESGGMVIPEVSFSEAVSCFSKVFISDAPGASEPCSLMWELPEEELDPS